MTHQAFATLIYARRYLDAGYSVIPLRLDGTKGPAVESWKPFSLDRPSRDQVEAWFASPAGIGLITGSVSGGFEVIDFDMKELLWPLLSLLPRSLRDRLTIVETPTGWHLAYRCTEVFGNKKLAMWEPARSISQQQDGTREYAGSIGKGVRIETRGEGGYIVAEGSPLSVHAAGLPYVHYMGPTLFEIETITPGERAMIWTAAASFDCGIHHESIAIHAGTRRAKQEHFGGSSADVSTPWDWFDRYGHWPDILEPAGWRACGHDAWTRPGKQHGVSASVGTNEHGIEVLTVFSTSTELSGSYGKFNLLVALQFNGDRIAAAKHVRRMMIERSAA
jgi:hypothetical protein